MKDKIIKYLCALLAILLVTSCYDRDIIDNRESNHFVLPVEDVTLQDVDNSVTPLWIIPKDTLEDVVGSARIEIQVVESGIYRQKVTLSEMDPGHADTKAKAGRPYCFTIRVASSIKNENRVKGKPDQIYSKGVIVLR